MQSVQVQHDIRVTDLLFYPHRISYLVMNTFHCRFYIPFEYNVFPVQYALARETHFSSVLGLEYKLLISKIEDSNVLSHKKRRIY